MFLSKDLMLGQLPLHHGIVCAYHPAVMGSSPKHTIYAFNVKLCTIFVIVLRKGGK